MHRRHAIASALAACTLPWLRTEPVTASPAPSDAGRLPIRELRQADGRTYGYLHAREDIAAGIESMTESPFIDTSDVHAVEAEFIPSGKWMVYIVETPQASEFSDPYSVPTEFGCWGTAAGESMTARWMTKDQAISAMVAHNRRAIGTGGNRWAVAVELGEPQGNAPSVVEFGSQSLARVTATECRPARIYGRN